MQNPLYVPIPAVPEGSRVEIGDDRQKSKKEAEDRKVASQLSSLEEKMIIMQGVDAYGSVSFADLCIFPDLNY